ncbi:MAG: hypothetical protein V9G04_13905 [Nocardioides sp.]
MPIPHRTMLLFTGPVSVLRDAAELAWHGTADGSMPPHLAWPEDKAWSMACEVDEEVEFSVGCSAAAAKALAEAMPDQVRQVAYGENAAMYRDG